MGGVAASWRARQGDGFETTLGKCEGSRLEGGTCGGVRKGSICHFAFSLVLQCLGVPRYPDAGKNSTKSVIVTPPLFVCPQMLVKIRTSEQCPHMLAGKAREK